MPKQRTEANKLNETCLIDDINDSEQLQSMLDKAKEYVDVAQISVLYNHDEFHPEKLGIDSIVKRSRILNRQFSAHSHPQFANFPVRVNLVEDEMAAVNLGQSTTYKYMDFYLNPNEFSYWRHYPEKYKFFSVHFDVS